MPRSSSPSWPPVTHELERSPRPCAGSTPWRASAAGSALERQPRLAAQRLEHRAAGPGHARARPSRTAAPSASRRAGVARRRCGCPPACARRSTSCPCGRAPARSRRCSSPAGGSARSSALDQLGRRGRRPLGPEQAAARGAAGRGAQLEYQRRRATVRPLCARPEPDGGLGHRERRGIGRACRRGRPCRTPSRPRRTRRCAPVLPGELRRRPAPAATPGSVVGMKSRSPSSMRGRNSPPSRADDREAGDDAPARR